MEKENWLCIAFNSTDPERGVGRNIFIRLINLHYISARQTFYLKDFVITVPFCQTSGVFVLQLLGW